MSLSDRERQVVVLVGLLGRTYMQVAIELGISPRTVEHHAERVAARSEFGYLPPRKALARVYLVELASPDLLLP